MKVHCSHTTTVTFSIARWLVFASQTVETGAGRQARAALVVAATMAKMTTVSA